jgi:chemotaxis protein MotB
MARSRRHHHRRRGGAHGDASHERWLLTYADMITLLMALFMVLFSISSVNISKVQSLQESLRAAFSGDILPGGKAIAKPGASANSSAAPSSVDLQSIVPVTANTATNLASSATHGSASSTSAAAESHLAAANAEASEFAHIKKLIDAYAAAHGFSSSVHAVIEPQGLVIRVLTDDLLFPSGTATLQSRSFGLLGEIAQLLNVDQSHPIEVEGNTDDVPIQSSQFPSNWELSTARASTVVRFLIAHGVGASRLTAVGYADQHPLDSNATAAGRARNRRVEIVLRRLYGSEAEAQL